MTNISLFTSIIIVFTIVIPQIPVPIININVTLQTFVVVLTGLMLSPTDAFISMLLYVFLGALGFPVFSGLQGGAGVIFGPSGGFIISFPIIAYLISYFDSKKNFAINFIINCFFGIVVLYLIATLWLDYYLAISYIEILMGMIIFIPFDIIKILLAIIVSKKLKSFIQQRKLV